MDHNESVFSFIEWLKNDRTIIKDSSFVVFKPLNISHWWILFDKHICYENGGSNQENDEHTGNRLAAPRFLKSNLAISLWVGLASIIRSVFITQVFSTWLPHITTTNLSGTHSGSNFCAALNMTQTGHLGVTTMRL